MYIVPFKNKFTSNGTLGRRRYIVDTQYGHV